MLDYLNDMLGLSAEVRPWEEAENLSPFLRSAKKYYIMQISGMECLLVEIVRDSFDFSAYREQTQFLPSGSMPIVLWCHQLDSKRRKTLIEARFPFIVPDSQAYLPFLGTSCEKNQKTITNRSLSSGALSVEVLGMLKYLNEVLGLLAEAHPWTEAAQFPLNLRKARRYSILQIDGVECVLVEVVEDSFSLPVLRKQMADLPCGSMPIVLCCSQLDSRRRETLIKERFAFVVPGCQAYLPFLGIALRERAKVIQSAPAKLSSTAQLILLYLIYEKDSFSCRKTDLTNQFNVSAISVTRAVRELQVLDLVSVVRKGREDWISRALAGRDLYEKALPYMIDPVKSRMFVRMQGAFRDFPLAGETALSGRSLLGEPWEECRAVYYREYNKLETVEVIDPLWTLCTDYIQLELWKYDPKLLADKYGVDVLSLSLSLRYIKDERVEQSIDDMMEDFDW